MEEYISIIVPIYKVPEVYLRRCIESIINQTYKNIEIILVDDGSPDNCGEICNEYSLKEEKIKVIHQENKGLCGARNTGIRQATSEWIMFVDGDDWIESNMCEELIKSSKEGIDIIFCGMIKDYETKRYYYEYDKFYTNNKVYSSNSELAYLRKMLLNFNGNNACAVAKLIKRKLIQEYDIYYNEELKQGAEALEFNLRLFEKAKAIKFIKKYFYHYMHNGESITTKHDEKNQEFVIQCFEKIRSEIDNNDVEIMFWFYNRMKYVILTTAISGYFSDSNPEEYSAQKRKFKKYLENNLVKETLKQKENSGLSLTRKITLFLIKHKMFLCVKLVSKVRGIQKNK